MIMLKKAFRVVAPLVKQCFYLHDSLKWHDNDASRRVIIGGCHKIIEMRGIVEYYGNAGDI